MSHTPLSDFHELSITQTMEESSPSPARDPIDRKGKGRASPSDNSDTSEGESEVEEDVQDDTQPPLFALSHCRQHLDGTNTRYAFQIAYAEMERFGIRVDEWGVHCSCPEQEMPCSHKDWLLHQLPLQHSAGRGSPHARLSAKGLDTVCREMGWELRSGFLEARKEIWRLEKHSSMLEPARQTRELLQERVDSVHNILETLSPLPSSTVSTIPALDDVFKSLKPGAINGNNIFVANDLTATLARLLIHDDRLFHQFDLLVPHEARDMNYFNIMKRNADIVCQLLDAYNERGPAVGEYTVIWCADELSTIAGSIHKTIRDRQDLSSVCREHAAKVLISILEMVVFERNKELYQNIRWHRHKRHGEPAIDRNLYLRLIGSPSPANPHGDDFVINALRDLPETTPHIERLREISRRVEGRGEYVGWSAPSPYTTQPYKANLAALITQLASRPVLASTPSTPGPSASPGKRSAGSSSTGREAKRMR